MVEPTNKSIGKSVSISPLNPFKFGDPPYLLREFCVTLCRAIPSDPSRGDRIRTCDLVLPKHPVRLNETEERLGTKGVKD